MKYPDLNSANSYLFTLEWRKYFWVFDLFGSFIFTISYSLYDIDYDIIVHIKDPNKSNNQKYFRHSNVKRYELALLRSGYFIYFCRLVHCENRSKN